MGGGSCCFRTRSWHQERIGGSHPGGRRSKTTTTRAEQSGRNQMPKQEEGEDDNPGGRERDCGSAECQPEGRSGTPGRREAPTDNHPRPARTQLCKKSNDCAQARRKSLLQRQQVKRSSTTCPTPSVGQQRLEVTAEALAGLVPVRNSIVTEATVQTELASATRRRRWTRWRTTVTSRGPSSPKPKITSTAAERCTTCII